MCRLQASDDALSIVQQKSNALCNARDAVQCMDGRCLAVTVLAGVQEEFHASHEQRFGLDASVVLVAMLVVGIPLPVILGQEFGLVVAEPCPSDGKESYSTRFAVIRRCQARERFSKAFRIGGVDGHVLFGYNSLDGSDGCVLVSSVVKNCHQWRLIGRGKVELACGHCFVDRRCRGLPIKLPTMVRFDRCLDGLPLQGGGRVQPQRVTDNHWLGKVHERADDWNFHYPVDIVVNRSCGITRRVSTRRGRTRTRTRDLGTDSRPLRTDRGDPWNPSSVIHNGVPQNIRIRNAMHIWTRRTQERRRP
mmetsp:Transcript_18472/g.51537  ORF Transcript_18472/g.51537 Transcript_18472/m.51537 type:complete len:306 (+) Transcript_18472:2882-3799(+)